MCMCVENEWILRLEKKKDSIFGNGKLVDPSKKKNQSDVEKGEAEFRITTDCREQSANQQHL